VFALAVYVGPTQTASCGCFGVITECTLHIGPHPGAALHLTEQTRLHGQDLIVDVWTCG